MHFLKTKDIKDDSACWFNFIVTTLGFFPFYGQSKIR